MAAESPRRTIPLAQLRAWAREWDVEGDGACWPAERFVEWVDRNLRDRADSRPSGIRAAAQLRGKPPVSRSA